MRDERHTRLQPCVYNSRINTDQLSLEPKWKLKLNQLEGHPGDVTWCQQHHVTLKKKGLFVTL